MAWADLVSTVGKVGRLSAAAFALSAATLATPSARLRAQDVSALSRLAAIDRDDGIALSWPTGSEERPRVVWRSESGGAFAKLSEAGFGGFLDRAAAANIVYRYRVEGVAGEAVAVRVDRRKPFQCPTPPPLPADATGDRVERFVAPSGAEVSFTIRAPRPGPEAATLHPCDGAPGCSDYANLRDALARLAPTGGTLRLEAGVFRISPPPGARPWAMLDIRDARDLVVAGPPPKDGRPQTVLIFDAAPERLATAGATNAIGVSASRRVAFRHLVVDWSRPMAIPGHIEIEGPQRRFVVHDGPRYIPDPTQPPALSAIDAFDLGARVYAQTPHNRHAFAPGTPRFNPDFARDKRYFYSFDNQFYPAGMEALGIVYSGTAVAVGRANEDIAFDDVQIWAGGGPGFVFAVDGRGFRISSSRVTRKPDALLAPGEAPRFISVHGDSDARATRGEILIENSEFGFVEDDGFNIVGSMTQGGEGTRILADDEIRYAYKGFDPFANPHRPGDVLGLSDPVTLEPLPGSPVKVARRVDHYDAAAGVWSHSFTLERPLPALRAYRDRPLAELPYFSDPGVASAPFVVRNSCFHDTPAGRLIVQSGPGLIEGNVVAMAGVTGIELSAHPVAWREGPGARDVIVRDNLVVGSGWSVGDFDRHGHVWGALTGELLAGGITVQAIARDGFYASGAPNAWIEIRGNTIIDAPGLGVAATGVADVVVADNLLVNVNRTPFLADFDARHCGARARGSTPIGVGRPWCMGRVGARGSLMVVGARGARVFGNLALGSSQPIVVAPE